MEVLCILARCLTQHWHLNPSKYTSYDVIWVCAAIPAEAPTSRRSRGKHQDTHQGLYIMPQLVSLKQTQRLAPSQVD